MPALVPELVNMASDPAVSTADLLRRALVVARRLDVPELVEWISSELSGYRADVPDYRKLRGTLKAHNPIRGYVPLLMSSAEQTAALSVAHLRQAVPELEKLAEGANGLFASLDRTLEKHLMDAMNYPMRPVLSLSATQVHGAIEVIRTRVLEWALDLEGRGIIGEGMSFTPQEKQAVQQHYHFGDVSGSQIQISSNGSTQTQANTTGTDIDALKGLVQALGATLADVKGDSADELRADLATLKAQADSPKPKWEIIKATARSIKTVAEGAAGNILASLAQPHMATLMALAAA